MQKKKKCKDGKTMIDAPPSCVAIATWDFGLQAVENAAHVLHENTGYQALLDAIVRGIESVELDPKVSSVGYGGLPNADGVLQLDAALMLGNGRGGSVSREYWLMDACLYVGVIFTRFPCSNTYSSPGIGEKSTPLSLWKWCQKVCRAARFSIGR